MKYDYSDGSIETFDSPCCCPPDIRHDGLHTRGFTFWARLNEGGWKRIYMQSRDKAFLSSFKTAKEAWGCIEFYI